MSFTMPVLHRESNSVVNINVDFEILFLAGIESGVSSDIKCFIKFYINNSKVKVAKGLNDLVLKFSQRRNNTNAEYINVKDLISDYVYDIIYGHSENIYGLNLEMEDSIF